MVLDAASGTVTVEIDDASQFYGVDGYPITPEAICAGDRIEVVQERRGERWITLEVHLL